MQKQSVPNRLGELLDRRGLEPYDVSAELRVDPSTVYRWKKGGTIPDDKKVALAQLLDVSVGYLMLWDEPVAQGANA